MSQQIMFFKKNLLDFDNEDATITVTDAVATEKGDEYLPFMRNRNNLSAWLTTDSTDAANTTLVFDFIDARTVTDLFLIGHNLKAYTLKYWNGSSYVDFSTPIAETTNSEETTHYSVDAVDTSRIQLVITGTFTADDDKIIKQAVFTEKLGAGQLEGWPMIRKPKFDRNKRVNNMLSGKVSVMEGVGAFEAELDARNWNISADINLMELIYNRREGVLMWLSGGDETQFSRAHQGYRKEDLFLVRPIDDYQVEFSKSLYKNGLKFKAKLKEAID